MNRRSGHIYDKKSGQHVAWIEGDNIFSASTKKKCATLRGAAIDDLTGKFVGNLDEAGKVGGDTAASDRFTALTNGE